MTLASMWVTPLFQQVSWSCGICGTSTRCAGEVFGVSVFKNYILKLKTLLLFDMFFFIVAIAQDSSCVWHLLHKRASLTFLQPRKVCSCLQRWERVCARFELWKFISFFSTGCLFTLLAPPHWQVMVFTRREWTLSWKSWTKESGCTFFQKVS